MIILIILLILSLLHALDPAHLKPGAHTASLGRVSLVQDYLWIRNPFANLVDMPDRLLDLTEQLSITIKELHGHMLLDVKYTAEMRMLLKECVEDLRDTITNTLENSEELYFINRAKRGLVDGLGQLSRMLFGTALDIDVKDLQECYNNLASVAMSNNKAVQLNYRNTTCLTHRMHKMLNYTNLLSSLNKAFASVDYLYALDEVF